MSRTALVASQLLYDLVLDKQETGAILCITDLLALNEIIKVADVPAQHGLNQVLRDVLYKERKVTDSDLWAVEHYLSSGLASLEKETSNISPARETSNAAIDLLSDFWAEKAVTGDVLSEEERNYAVFLLNHLEIDWESKTSELNIKFVLKNKLPGPPSKRNKKVSFNEDATVPSREPPASPRKSPRIQKRGWPSYNFLSRFFK